MAILCTFPGKFGDLLWALPTLRALARRTGEAIDLMVSTHVASIATLVSQQPYIGQCFVHPGWEVREASPISPRTPPEGRAHEAYHRVIHLGYRAWPNRALPFEVLDTFNGHHFDHLDPLTDEELDLQTPWITVGAREHFVPFQPRKQARIAVGFTDEWFELKYGVTELIDMSHTQWAVTVIGNSPRWNTEAGCGAMIWAEQLAAIQAATLFVGCCSALHVLAVAAGCPAIVMEPCSARHHPIFYPLGMASPQVTLVHGNDSRPTFDARHVVEAIEQRLAQIPWDNPRRQKLAALPCGCDPSIPRLCADHSPVGGPL